MKKYQKWLVTTILVFLALCITAVACPMVFYMNDDVTMRNILSGAYSGVPDGHAVYMKYPLTGIISLLYRLAGGIPWFSLFMIGCLMLAATMVLGHIVCELKTDGCRKVGILVGVALMCVVLFLPHVIYLHYTIVAAMLGGCGLMLTMLGDRHKAILLFVICYCVRSQVFFLLIPFLVVSLLWQLDKNKWRELLQMLAVLAGCILVCMIWNGLMYRSEGWQKYQVYNASRTELYDYGSLLGYEEYTAQYEAKGIGKQEYVILDQYVLALDSSMNAEILQAAADIYEERLMSERNPVEYLKFCMSEYYYHTVYTDKPYQYLLIAAYFLAAVGLLWQKRWRQLGLLCCMAVGRSLIWIYLIWQGRFPERIYISLYLLEIPILVAMSCAVLADAYRSNDMEQKHEDLIHNERKKSGSIAMNCIIVVCCLALLGAGIYQMRTATGRAAEQQEALKEWTALTDYCASHGDNIYLLDVRSMVSYAGRVWEPTANGQNNYLLAGGWMSGTPLIQERFQMLEATDGGELLVGRGNASGEVLYISSPERSAEWLTDYISQRFGETEVELLDSILLDGQEIFYVYGVAAQ